MSLAPAERSANLKLMVAAARAAEAATGCPGLLQIAQVAQESGWLEHAPGNNCAGFKEYPGCFGRQLLHSTEWFTPSEVEAFLRSGDGRTAEVVPNVAANAAGRRKYSVQDWFATFATLADCFVKRASAWDCGPYKAAAARYRIDGDLPALVNGISHIYATDPNYANEILRLIHQSDVQAAWAEET